jgi:hypothetical protein
LTVVVSVPPVPVIVVILGKVDHDLAGHVPGLCESSKNIVVVALQIKSFSGMPSAVWTPKSPWNTFSNSCCTILGSTFSSVMILQASVDDLAARAHGGLMT